MVRVALLAAIVIAGACGSAAQSARQAPAAAPPPSDAAALARCENLLLRRVTPCPPARMPSEPIAIRNATHGAVSDADARAQGEAYLRSHALYVWAVGQEAGDAFLLSGAIVPAEIARTNIFRSELQVFADARAAGGRARVRPLATTEITLVPVPDGLRELARRDGLLPSPFAWVDNQAGPGGASVESGGAVRDVVRVGAGEPHPILVFGQVRNDADLGPLWYLGGEYGCLASVQVRAVCGL